MPTITIRGKVRNGRLILPKKFAWPATADIEITMHTPSTNEDIEATIRKTAGAWKDTADCGHLVRDIYASRRRGLTDHGKGPYPEVSSPRGRRSVPLKTPRTVGR